jgi:hypothetical protein
VPEWEVEHTPNGEYIVKRRRCVRLLRTFWRRTPIVQEWFTVGGVPCDWYQGELGYSDQDQRDERDVMAAIRLRGYPYGNDPV